MNQLGDLLTQTAGRYGLDPQTFTRIGQIESGLNPNAGSSLSSAKGLFQFTNPTWAQYGRGGNVFDPASNADAAARYLLDVRRTLHQALGREPTPGELYLGHQQGAGGASALLTHPDAPAASLVGLKAVVNNGGRQDMSARDFAELWARKMGSAPSTPLLANGPVGMARPAGQPATLASLADAVAPAAPQPEPTMDEALQLALSSGGARPARGSDAAAQEMLARQQAEEARRRALITGTGDLAALFA